MRSLSGGKKTDRLESISGVLVRVTASREQPSSRIRLKSVKLDVRQLIGAPIFMAGFCNFVWCDAYPGNFHKHEG